MRYEQTNDTNGSVTYKASFEKVRAQVFESRARQRRIEVDAVDETVNIDWCTGLRGQGTLRSLRRRAQTPRRARRFQRIGRRRVLSLELLCQMTHDARVKVFTTQVRVAGGGAHLKHTLEIG